MSVATANGVAHPVRPVLLSSEPWDDVWRRNQQLASRIPGTVYVEPAQPGVHARWRDEGGVAVLTPVKALPLRWGVGREACARMTAREIHARFPDGHLVVWATHALTAPLAEELVAPIVYDRTDDWPAMEQSPSARRLVERLDSQLLRDADELVVVSEAMLSRVRPDARHIPNGVDSAAYAKPPPAPRNGRLRVAFIGTVDPFRFDFDILNMVARTPGVTLVVAGPGASVNGAENLGVVPHEELPDLLASCDALLAPYRTDCEANRTSDSLKLYEYFATGLPVIATPTAGFQRFPDLVAYWPVTPSIHDVIARLSVTAATRREIARHADWRDRAAAMQQVLFTAAHRW